MQERAAPRVKVQPLLSHRCGDEDMRPERGVESLAHIFGPVGEYSAFIARLFRKLDSGASTSETEGMAVAGIVSTQLLVEQAALGFPRPRDAETPWDVHVDRTAASGR